MPHHAIALHGCAPIPLAHYLKALGILRLVAEQRDRDARGHWEKDIFVLTSSLDQAALMDFFLTSYEPTPVIAPWNGGSGFFPKDNDEAISALSRSAASRFRKYQEVVGAAKELLKNSGLKEKPSGEHKNALLLACRSSLPEEFLAWFDAVAVLGDEGAKFPPLLGTGGNDGRLEFTNNFMQRLVELFDAAGGMPNPSASSQLKAALFGGTRQSPPSKAPVGQFFPGAAGGANTTAGFAADSAVNPWDFVLMIEGALLFAAATVKRLESLAPGALVYPFCVRQVGAGYGSAALADEKEARCEIWAPLWSQPTSLDELRAVFGEGRAHVNGRPARHGVDFARAVATLGVDRGIDGFQRYGFQVRNGLAYFATPLERMPVRRNPSVDLLSEADEWLDRFRQAATGDRAPASVQRALRQLDESILALCRERGNAARVLQVLVALGQAERALARSLRWTLENRLRPLGGLDREKWFAELNGILGGHDEAQLAASLASLTAPIGPQGRSLSFRAHLESAVIVRRNGSVETWFEERPSPDVVWKSGGLADVLNAVFARRLINAQRAAEKAGFERGRPVSFASVARFIEGAIDDRLLADLLWGFSLLDWETRTRSSTDDSGAFEELGNPPSAFFALLRLCFAPPETGQPPLPVVPAIHRHASTGNGVEAARLAARRLRASGFSLPRDTASPVFPLDDTGARELGRSIAPNIVRRTAAALLFPLTAAQLGALRLARLSRQLNLITIQ